LYENKRHRVRCGAAAGSILTVVSVDRRGSEWLVGFEAAGLGRVVYAKTSQGDLHEFVYGRDLDSAKKRWMGKKVFSARGFINNLEGGRGGGTVKVDVRQPLLVLDVRPGLTPLPAKPLLIMVETLDGKKGAIPTRFSWTNSPLSQRHEGNPWGDDLLESDPSGLCAADSATWAIINAHKVREGMSRDQVRLSWGRPAGRSQTVVNGAERECWEYENQRLWFDAKELVGIEEK
jgi:hypothetical protein